MEQTASIVVPGTIADYIPRPEIFHRLGLDNGFVLETVLYAWPWRDQRETLYDVLSEQWTGEPGGTMAGLPIAEHFDDYFEAIVEIIRRLIAVFAGLDSARQNSVEYADIVGMERGPQPFFVVRFHYGM